VAIARTRQHDDVTVVEIEGHFDATSAPDVKAELHRMIEKGLNRLVLNLRKMSFIDSAGLGAMVSCLRRAAARGGDVRLAEVPAFCRSVFELTRLTRVFDVTQTEQEAIEAVRQGSRPL